MATIEKRGNGYRKTVSNGYDTAGKQIREKTTFTPDPKMTDKQQKKALEKFVFEFEQKVKSGKFLDGEKITFKDFTDKWLNEYADQQLELSTINRYKVDLNKKILHAIGHIKLTKLQPLHLQTLYNNLLEDGVRKDGKSGGYAPASIKKCHSVINIILRTAVQWQLIESNICDRIAAPKIKKGVENDNFFTPEQAIIF